MSVLKKTKVAAGIAAAVFATGAAQAATISDPSTDVPPEYSKTIVNEVTQEVVTLRDIIILLGATESLNVDDSVTFTLNGGATWGDIASGDLDDNVGAANYSLVSGGPGETFATFRVNDAPSGVNANLTLTGTEIDMSTATGSTTTVTAVMSGFVGGVATDLFGSPLTSLAVRSVPMMSLDIDTLATGTFDVATGFTQLLVTGNTSATATANITTSAAAANEATSNAAGDEAPDTDPDPAATVLMLSGPMASVDSIETNGSITSATCDGGVPTGGSQADEFWIDTTTDMACAILAPGTNAPGTSDIIDVEITFDGTTTNTASSYVLDVSRVDDNDYDATDVGSGTLFMFGRNGSAFATNSFGPLNKITVSDRSGSLGGTGAADGMINLTVYDKEGNEVTCTGLTIDQLTSDSTVTIQGTDVLTACPGGKRIEGTVNSNSILVTNVKTTADGATATPALSSGGVTAAQ